MPTAMPTPSNLVSVSVLASHAPHGQSLCMHELMISLGMQEPGHKVMMFGYTVHVSAPTPRETGEKKWPIQAFECSLVGRAILHACKLLGGWIRQPN